MSLVPVTALRSSLAERRTARVQRQRLARELAAYSSDADRLELDLILGRHSADDTAAIESILSHQASSASYRLTA